MCVRGESGLLAVLTGAKALRQVLKALRQELAWHIEKQQRGQVAERSRRESSGDEIRGHGRAGGTGRCRIFDFYSD